MKVSKCMNPWTSPNTVFHLLGYSARLLQQPVKAWAAAEVIDLTIEEYPICFH